MLIVFFFLSVKSLQDTHGLYIKCPSANTLNSEHEYFNQLHLRLHSREEEEEEEEGHNRANMTSEWCKTPSGCLWSLTQVAASLHFYRLIMALCTIEHRDKVSQHNTEQKRQRRKLKTINNKKKPSKTK